MSPTYLKRLLIALVVPTLLITAVIALFITLGAEEHDPAPPEAAEAIRSVEGEDEDSSGSETERNIHIAEPNGEEPLPPEAEPPEIDDSPSAAELADLQSVADQEGISLQDAIDRYAWNDNFALVVSGIRRAYPEEFARAEIVDAGHAWIGFAGSAPEGSLAMLDRFIESHSGVSVEIRTDLGFTEVEIQKAVRAVHYAVLESPNVLDAVTFFEFEARQIRSAVVLQGTASDSVLEDLKVVAANSLTDATRDEVLDVLTISVIRSNSPVLGSDD